MATRKAPRQGIRLSLKPPTLNNTHVPTPRPLAKTISHTSDTEVVSRASYGGGGSISPLLPHGDGGARQEGYASRCLVFYGPKASPDGHHESTTPAGAGLLTQEVRATRWDLHNNPRRKGLLATQGPPASEVKVLRGWE